ncbi:MAG TPA: heparin lyase I family protein [Burkholderiales bacterium]|nr:heparin lyase I family protein [Burkholderiales bacterium]
MKRRLVTAALCAALSIAAHAAPNGLKFKAPGAGATISGNLYQSSECELTGSGNIRRVSFFLDSTQLNTDNSAPWNCDIDTRKFADGTHTLRAVAYDSRGASASTQISVNIKNTTTSTSGTSGTSGYSGTPYSGTPVALPKAFPAVDFDKGGQNVAYRDLSSGNAGGQYRTSEDVDIVNSGSDPLSAYAVNGFQTGEWLAYTVNVPADGKYDIALNASTNYSSTPAFRVEVDGVNVTGKLSVPSTGSWSSFKWVGKQGVDLKAGKRVLKVVSEAEYFNLNGVSVLASATAPAPAAGQLQFSCSFENSPTDCGFVEQAKEPGRATLVNVARDGARAVRLNTQPGDSNVSGSGTWERNDLRLPQADTDCYEGKEAWWANSILFPSDYVVPTSGGVVLDFHHTGSSGQANFHVDAMSYGLRLRGYGGATVDSGRYEVTLGPVVRNAWYDFVYHVRWSSGSDGFMHVWVNGVKKLAHFGPTLYSGMGCYLKLANYHDPFGQASSVIHDRVRRGTTWSDVSITPLEGVQ